MHLLYEVWPLKRFSLEMKEFLSCANVTPSSDILGRSNRKGRWTDEYCSFSEIIHIALPPPLAHRYIYLISISLTCCHDDDREWCQCQWKQCGGGRGAAAEEKGSNDPVTFDTLLQMQNGYSSRNLTKRASFDGKWYRQWPVAGSVGCLSASREAYQMTLKISSTTIKFEGGTEWGAVAHIRWACKCAWWWQRRWGEKKPLFNDFFVSIVVIVGTLIIAPPHLPKKEPNTYIETFWNFTRSGTLTI